MKKGKIRGCFGLKLTQLIFLDSDIDIKASELLLSADDSMRTWSYKVSKR